MAATRLISARPILTRSNSTDSVLSTITVEASSHVQSLSSSTPPSSAADSTSVSSTSLKLYHTSGNETDAEVGFDRVKPSNCRTRRSHMNIFGTYNVKVLSGTAIHAPRKYRNTDDGETGVATRRRTISGDTLLGSPASASTSHGTVVEKANKLVHDGVEALDLQWSTNGLSRVHSRMGHGLGECPSKGRYLVRGKDIGRRRSSRLTGEKVESLTKKLNVLGKRGRHAFEAGFAKAKRELKNLTDTNEYAKIDTKPVVAEVWSNGKLVTEDQPSKKKVKVGGPTIVPKTKEEQSLVTAKLIKRREKVWLNKGLYAGQEARDLDWFRGKTDLGNIKYSEYKPNGYLPLPMWHGQRILHTGRNFKLPFDICSPLPPGQPKPDEWRKVPKNRFVGDAAAAWKKSTVFDDFSSRCVCSQLNGCDDSCQNRIMLYECDDGNCSAGREHCTNRAFADLQERRSKGGKYRIGVEVIKTADRGYGVRTNRCFDPHQIIVEYTGEIITEEECDRRMNEVYKDNECYYLMLFDQNMIIDATRGSIARFVNHSCEPNCRMVKWIVAGKPRMALFAGDRSIMTGEELTYDYNFDPFSAKNVQECRCGSETCRGVLGPRPKDQKPRGTVGESIKQAVSAGKRKLKEFLGGEDNKQQSPKKRKAVVPARRLASKKATNAPEGPRYSLSKIKRARSTVVKKKITKPRIIKKLGSRARKENRMLPSSHNSRPTLAKASQAGRKKNAVTKAGRKNNAVAKVGRARSSSKRRRSIIKGLKKHNDKA